MGRFSMDRHGDLINGCEDCLRMQAQVERLQAGKLEVHITMAGAPVLSFRAGTVWALEDMRRMLDEAEARERERPTVEAARAALRGKEPTDD